MRSEFVGTAKALPACLGTGAPFTRAGPDQLTLELGQAAERGHNQAAMCRGISPFVTDRDALLTPRLIIRDVRASDAAAFHAYMLHEDYRRDLFLYPPSKASVVEMLTRWLEDQTEQPRASFAMAATDRSTGEVIGEAILRIRNQRWQQGEIEWGLRSEHVSQGLGIEIGHAMLGLAFGRFRLHRVYARCRVENRASRRIIEKLGMSEEGILRENVLARGKWWSSVQCGILASEYAGRVEDGRGGISD